MVRTNSTCKYMVSPMDLWGPSVPLSSYLMNAVLTNIKAAVLPIRHIHTFKNKSLFSVQILIFSRLLTTYCQLKRPCGHFKSTFFFRPGLHESKRIDPNCTTYLHVLQIFRILAERIENEIYLL